MAVVAEAEAEGITTDQRRAGTRPPRVPDRHDMSAHQYTPGSTRPGGFAPGRAPLVLTILVLSALSLGAGALDGQRISWTGTVQYAQGDYFFTETTRSWSFFTGLNLQGDRARLSLGIPVVAQDSRAITFVGELPLPTGGPDNEVVSGRGSGERVPMGGGRRSAAIASMRSSPPVARQTTTSPDSVEAPGEYRVQMADPVLGAGLLLVPARGRFTGLDISASVKIPVRDVDSGVGTGEMDFGVSVSSGISASGVLLFADVGWWSYGDLPGLELKDVVNWGVGAGALLGERASGILSLSGASRIMETADPPLDLNGLLSLRINSRMSVTVGAGMGLSEVSPDFTLSAGTRLSFGG